MGNGVFCAIRAEMLQAGQVSSSSGVKNWLVSELLSQRTAVVQSL
jgi:hypothetical protein